MQQLVRDGKTDETIIFLAQQLARTCDRDDFRCQASRIFEYVKKNIHYVQDPTGTELLRSPICTLYYRAGDCDDQAVLFSALAESIGLRTRFKTIKASAANPDEFSHVYSEVLIPNRGWMPSDTIVSTAKLGWEAPHHFGVHTWEGMGMIGSDIDTGAAAFGMLGRNGTMRRGVRPSKVTKMLNESLSRLRGKYTPDQIRRGVLAVASKQGALGDDIRNGASAFGRAASLSYDVGSGAEAFGEYDLDAGAEAFGGMAGFDLYEGAEGFGATDLEFKITDTVVDTAPVERNFWGKLADSMKSTVADVVKVASTAGAERLAAELQSKGATTTMVRAPGPSIPGWVGPAAVVGLAGLLAVLVVRRKRRQ